MAKHKFYGESSYKLGHFVRDESLRAINHFEKVLRNEISLDDFVRERSGYGLKTRIKVVDKDVTYLDEEPHGHLLRLINNVIINKGHCFYIKFLGNYTKPYTTVKRCEDMNESNLTYDYVPYKYGLEVFYAENGRFYSFIFAPLIHPLDKWMTSFAIIPETRLYNYIKINKPKIKKDIEGRRKLPTLYLIKNLGNGMQGAVPDMSTCEDMN